MKTGLFLITFCVALHAQSLLPIVFDGPVTGGGSAVTLIDINKGASAMGAPLTATTAALNTTGANLLILGCVGDNTSTGATPSDSKGNSWTLVDTNFVTTPGTLTWYSVPTSVGAGHTFACTFSTVGFTGVVAAAFSNLNASPLDHHLNGFGGSGTTFQPGSITLTSSGLYISVMSDFDTGSASVNSSFINPANGSVPAVGGQNYSIYFAYKIVTSGGSENPTWTASTSQTAFTGVNATFIK